jgi:hypothetical protein
LLLLELFANVLADFVGESCQFRVSHEIRKPELAYLGLR